MNVLLLGSGGRENALAWKIVQSPLLHQLYVAPGNPGTARLGKNLPINIMDFDQVAAVIVDHRIDLLVIGPEAPLVAGLTDHLRSIAHLSHLLIIGPGAQGALLEGSKEFAKAFMARHHIPTADYKSFTSGDYEEAVRYVESLEAPWVIKADGLAAGKGVVICSQKEEATAALKRMLIDKQFGTASDKVVIEKFLTGIELSVFVITDSKNYCLLPEAKDYKRIGEGDTGLNTGGMGAISPVPFADEHFMKKVVTRIVEPTIEGLSAEKIDYRGFIFFGLINVAGEPWVIEYNTRMGDPETEVVIPRVAEDILPLLVEAAKGELTNRRLNIDPRSVATVMLVSAGYPGDYAKGRAIRTNRIKAGDLVFHAGTAIHPTTGNLITNGGRVLAVTAFGNDVKNAFDSAYDIAERIEFEGMNYRRDLGNDLTGQS